LKNWYEVIHRTQLPFFGGDVYLAGFMNDRCDVVTMDCLTVVLASPSPKRVPFATVEEILRLYQEQYADFKSQGLGMGSMPESLRATWLSEVNLRVSVWNYPDRPLRNGLSGRVGMYTDRPISVSPQHARSSIAGARGTHFACYSQNLCPQEKLDGACPN